MLTDSLQSSHFIGTEVRHISVSREQHQYAVLASWNAAHFLFSHWTLPKVARSKLQISHSAVELSY